MQHDSTEKEVVRKSALIYLSITVGAVTLFFLATNLFGGYSPVARIGGMVWVGLLSLIVSMPVVIARVKHRARE